MSKFSASRLRARRRQLGMTQLAVCRRAGLSTVSLSAIERGRKEPRAGTLARLAAALDCEAGYFFIK
jgi:transcriptional regulator with XRE-family HTH domain